MKWFASVALAYGIIMIALGAYAFVKDKSIMSLVGGGGLGVLAIVGAFLGRHHPTIGYGLAALATIAAMGRFAKPFFAEQKMYPAGLIFGLSAITLICLAIGHFASGGQGPKAL
jgi:uncharacterized membrane protein (UPF0136 family)